MNYKEYQKKHKIDTSKPDPEFDKFEMKNKPEKHSKECQKRTGVSHIECECWCHACPECQFEDNAHSQSCSKHVEKEHKVTCHHRTSHIHDNKDFKCRCICTCFIRDNTPRNAQRTGDLGRIEKPMDIIKTRMSAIEENRDLMNYPTKIYSVPTSTLEDWEKEKFKFIEKYQQKNNDDFIFALISLISDAQFSAFERGKKEGSHGDYGRRMFQRGHAEGRKEMREECLKSLPKKLHAWEYKEVYVHCTEDCISEVTGFNICLNELLSAITNIKI